MAASERRLLVSYEAANDAGSHGPTSAVARDAALGGLFIETKTPLAVGSLLSVELSAPNSTATLEARVFSTRAKEDGPTKPAGMAVRFLDLPSGMLGKLQSILDHHRPPAHTRLGVGDENEALWASAGGRDDQAIPDDEVLEIAASVAVDGRPTPEMPAPIEAATEPKPPRYPTPRMIPLRPAPSSTSQPQQTEWSSPPSAPYLTPSSPLSAGPSFASTPSHGLSGGIGAARPVLGTSAPPKSRAPLVIVILALVVLAIIASVFAMRLR
jgi:hypothetical protein